ncbi:hypothetical protein ABTE05_20980, partial [Acinetobacter baumannii]
AVPPQVIGIGTCGCNIDALGSQESCVSKDDKVPFDQAFGAFAGGRINVRDGGELKPPRLGGRHDRQGHGMLGCALDGSG